MSVSGNHLAWIGAVQHLSQGGASALRAVLKHAAPRFQLLAAASPCVHPAAGGAEADQLGGEIVVGVRPPPAVEPLPGEPQKTMATTTLSLALRATTDGRTALLVRAGRSGPRERWSDGQGENDGGDEDGLAKYLASRRSSEL